MGIDDESSHPALCSEVAGGVTRIIVSLFREPDAGNPPVRFDEREPETEPSQTGLRRRRESFVSGHREAKATAPVLDSTPNFTHLRAGTKLRDIVSPNIGGQFYRCYSGATPYRLSQSEGSEIQAREMNATTPPKTFCSPWASIAGRRFLRQ
jgi:hypothetical protein